MRRLALLRLVGPVVAGLASAGPAIADGQPRPKPSEVGPGSAPGTVRRTIQPFGDWTLVCDEDLKRKQRVCNVSQSFVDAAGATAFSWSLAATRGGAPVMILRAPNVGGDPRRVTVSVDGAPRQAEVALATCDAATCLGFLPLGREMAQRLQDGAASAAIGLGKDGGTITAPLSNLPAALAALR